MNRDHLLFLVLGLLGGFLLGYLVQETVAARQPAAAWPTNNQPAQAAATEGAAATPDRTGRVAADVVTEASSMAPGAQAAMEEVQRLRAFVASNPTDAAAVRRLADLNYEIANWTRAAELYEQFLSLQPDDVDGMTDLGVAYRFLARQEEALALFRRVRSLDPEHWPSRYNEVLILAVDLGRLDEAEPLLSELVALQPDNDDVERLAEAVAQRR